MNHSKQILWHIILISLMNAMTYIYFGTYIWLRHSSLLLNAICNYLLFFTTFTFISHCKIVKQTNLFFPLLLVCRNFPNFIYCIFTREHRFLRLSKKFFTFLSLFGMLDVYLELFCLN